MVSGRWEAFHNGYFPMLILELADASDGWARSLPPSSQAAARILQPTLSYSPHSEGSPITSEAMAAGVDAFYDQAL